MSGKKLFISIILLLAITFLAFLPSLNNNFVTWDDQASVIENPAIKNFSLQNIKKIFTSRCIADYAPLSILTFVFDYQILKLNPFIYHSTNLKLHLFNCVLVFWLIFLISQNIYLAFTVALLFGIHPQHVESVAWITSKDALYSFFFLASLISYIYYLKAGHKKHLYLALVYFFFSLLSKVIVLILPLILIMLDFLFGRRFDKKCWLEKVPFFFLALIFGLVGIFTQNLVKSLSFIGSFAPVKFLLNFNYCLYFLFVKIFWPVKLACLYPAPFFTGKFFFGNVFLPAVVVLFLVLTAIFSAKFNRRITFGILFFLIMLLPLSGLVFSSRNFVNDRYSYLSSIGIFYLLGLAFLFFYERVSLKIKKALVVLFWLVMGVLFVLTWRQATVWKNGLTLWSNMINKYPYIDIAYNQRGLAYQLIGQEEKAEADFSRAVKINPSALEPLFNRGRSCLRQKKYAQAIRDFSQVLKLKPEFKEAYLHRALAYHCQKNDSRAKADFQKALKLEPKYSQVYLEIGRIDEERHKIESAVANYLKALELDANSAEAHFYLAALYQTQEKLEPALVHFKKALQINPQLLEAHYNLALIFNQRGQYQQAIAELNQFLRTENSRSEGYYQRALAYYHQKQFQKAMADCLRVLKFDSQNASADNLLGNCYKKSGDLEEAITCFSEAIKIKPNFPEAYVNRGLSYVAKRETESAIADFKRAVGLKPDYAEAYYNLGAAYYQNGQFEKVWANIEKSQQLGFRVAPDVLELLRECIQSQ